MHRKINYCIALIASVWYVQTSASIHQSPPTLLALCLKTITGRDTVIGAIQGIHRDLTQIFMAPELIIAWGNYKKNTEQAKDAYCTISKLFKQGRFNLYTMISHHSRDNSNQELITRFSNMPWSHGCDYLPMNALCADFNKEEKKLLVLQLHAIKNSRRIKPRNTLSLKIELIKLFPTTFSTTPDELTGHKIVLEKWIKLKTKTRPHLILDENEEIIGPKNFLITKINDTLFGIFEKTISSTEKTDPEEKPLEAKIHIYTLCKKDTWPLSTSVINFDPPPFTLLSAATLLLGFQIKKNLKAGILTTEEPHTKKLLHVPFRFKMQKKQ